MIVTGQLNNVLYIERAANVRAYSRVDLYQVSADMSNAKRVKLMLGRFARRYIEINSGGALSQQFIISDRSNLAATNTEITLQ